MRLWYLDAFTAIVVMAATSSVTGQSLTCTAMPDLPAAPNPVPACQSPCTSPCTPCNLGSTCNVTTMAELTKALYCYANSGQCATIMIPAGTTIPFCNTINITDAHEGVTVTINGTLLWVGDLPGPTEDASTLIRISGVRGTQGVTFNGSGSILSVHHPCDGGFGTGGTCADPVNIALCFVIQDSEHITIAGTSDTQPLTIQKLNTGVLVNADTSNDIELRNLKIEGMSEYGMFIGGSNTMSKLDGVIVDNCHVNGAYSQHGFRIYASNATVTNCSACNVDRSGLWIVEGKGVTVNGFQSEEYFRLGPNYVCTAVGPDEGERIMEATVNDLYVRYVEIEPGTLGCYLSNVTTTNEGIAIGQPMTNPPPPGQPNDVGRRPMNRIHWDPETVSPDTIHNTACFGPHRGCPGDVPVSDTQPGDGVVDVNDLLAVVGAWGNSTSIGACVIDSVCHSEFTEAQCTSLGGTFHGDGSTCWEFLTTGPCCKDDNGDGIWTCTITTPSSCWNAAFNNRAVYHGDLTSCSQVTCPSPPSTLVCPGTCANPAFVHRADIAPMLRPDGVVNVNDLLLVIGHWSCGEEVQENPPESLSDCWDEATEKYPNGGEEWAAAYDACVRSLCERGIIEGCDE